jgi:hypothetical protein
MKKLFSHIWCCLLCCTAASQVRETIHFHFDKDIYLSGETIWFKACLYNNTRPAITSTNIYTAIYDAAGKLLQQKQYPIFESVANGEFTLPDTLSNGSIIFRAFTKTMLQQDSLHAFQRVITIAGGSTSGATLPAEKATAGIMFFPEGGQLVAGLPNYLGISTRFTGGTAFATKGVIKANGTEITSFETGPAGITSVQFVPEINTEYYAEWTDENGHLAKADLPAVKNYGALLHTETAGNSLFYMVSKNTASANFSTLRLVAQQGADVVYKADLVMENGMKAVNNFRIDSLATGLLTVSLFDKEWNMLAQRTVFVNSPEPPLKVNINMLTSNRAARQKNVIEIEIPDSVKTNLSVSIADAAFYDEGPAAVDEALLLGENQRAAIQLPPPGDSTQAKQTDLLTLNHQWPRVQPGSTSKAPAPADDYLDLAFSSKKSFPAKEALTVIINDKVSGKKFLSIPPVGGSFTKSGLVFYDSAKIYYQLLKNKDMVDEVQPSAGSSLQVPVSIIPPVIYAAPAKKTAPAKDSSLFVNFVKAKPATFNAQQTLQNVTVKSRYINPATLRQQELEEKYASGPFRGLARGHFLNLLDDPSVEAVPDIFSYVAYRVPGLEVVESMKSGRMLIDRGTRRNPTSPMVFIDETEASMEMLQTIPISRIAYVKYISGIIVSLSFKTTGGAIYVYTKKGDEPLPPSKNMRTTFVKGYSSTQVFSQPDYESSSNMTRTDNRSTLYWNPYVITDAANRKFTIEYYNNDLSKKLLLVIEGMDETGRLVHIRKLIE